VSSKQCCCHSLVSSKQCCCHSLVSSKQCCCHSLVSSKQCCCHSLVSSKQCDIWQQEASRQLWLPPAIHPAAAAAVTGPQWSWPGPCTTAPLISTALHACRYNGTVGYYPAMKVASNFITGTGNVYGWWPQACSGTYDGMCEIPLSAYQCPPAPPPSPPAITFSNNCEPPACLGTTSLIAA
jgi:hypothetical protein